MWYFASGDSGFYFAEQLRLLSWLPQIWHSESGFGVSTLVRMWFDYPYYLIIKVLSSLGLSWWFIDKIIWIVIIFLAFYGLRNLAKYVLRNNHAANISSIIYATNTYFLLLFVGGQPGVACAFALAPLVFMVCIREIDMQSIDIRGQLSRGLWLSALIAADLRVAYMVIIAVFVYFLCVVRNVPRKIVAIYNCFVAPLIVAGFVHFYWILPTVVVGGSVDTLGSEFTNPGMLRFLSFADFSHALGLLHPNWPENLFGKIYFMQPEFLIIPLLAFSSLAWGRQKAINNKQPNRLLFTVYCPFFAFLALLGAFLSKGVNEPLGEIFQWMFVHVPGFIMFRDPTKFYLYIALSYSILIPSSIMFISDVLSERLKISLHKIQNFVTVGFVIFWLITLRAAFTGDVKGNFRPLELPREYIRLKDLLLTDNKPARTLWIPKKEKFVFDSEIHPSLNADQVFGNASLSAIMTLIQTPEFTNSLNASGVGYVIVPIDVEKRFFLQDYKFSEENRNSLIAKLDQSGFHRDLAFNDIAVFRNTSFNFTSAVPHGIENQQQYSNIGLVVSIISLISASVIMIISSKQKK